MAAAGEPVRAHGPLRRVAPGRRPACSSMGGVPELPEVDALASFLRARAVGRVVARVDVAGIQALKTYDPPPTALAGLQVVGVARHGKFLDLDVDGLHLVVHLARAGWLQWKESLPAAPPRPGKGPLALRVHLDDGSGFDLTEAGTQKRLAVYVVRDGAGGPRRGAARRRPAVAGVHARAAGRSARRCARPGQGRAHRPDGARRRRQRLQRRGAVGDADVALQGGVAR